MFRGLTTQRRKIKFQNNPRDWVRRKYRKGRHDLIIHVGWRNHGRMRSQRGEREIMERRGRVRTKRRRKGVIPTGSTDACHRPIAK